MMKKIIFLVMVLMLSGCVPAEKKEEGHSSMIITSDGEVISAYRDGEDVTDERKALEEQTEEAISRFLNRDRDVLEFDIFCMLEEDGMTVEVMVDGVSYTFTCSMQGDIIGMGRTDGNRFGLRGK
ncbi:hypothetical protein [Blautia producta]|uniref:Uncharacterized protein n=3 Tax=Blautia producta TaxID=33035 RepID=A0A7G5MPS5_9FIRM|nr:hypothetical protein [Blautia producta]QIB55521.1 hypothetical protein GXM18_11910 [Blautia producta ATCC 27340 = DSM 2950]QMW76618.1 hypothetical protein E5259_02845 [Blautia producta]